ncbi:hypothetical protein PNA2_1303 [Pyrococcus sp. NA2]|nr:hypothetical protein PNA2_1303 [Pyrococcus sp. NA2]
MAQKIEKTYVWSFSIDKETHMMIRKLAKHLGINNSAIVRMAVRKLYMEILKK